MREPRFEDYRDARDFFETVYRASRDAERTRLTLLEMEAKEDVRAQTYAERVSVGGERDRMAQTDARMDYEARMGERIDYDYALLDLACKVIYGDNSGKGGIDGIKGSLFADCLSFRYVDARPWSEVADLLGYSKESIDSLRSMCRICFDMIDQLGWGRVIDGDAE